MVPQLQNLLCRRTEPWQYREVTSEAASELEARRQLEHFYGHPLQRVVPDSKPSADYILPTPGALPSAFEVKELASPDWKQLHAALDTQQRSLDVPSLTRSWHVLLETTTLASRLTAVPNFPEDDEEKIARFAAESWIVTRKADRVAEWKRQAAANNEPVRLKNLLTDLIPHLETLEAHSVFATRGADYSHPDVRQALAAIAARTGDAICMGHEAHPDKGVPPGIQIACGYGQIRTENPDTIAERVQAWLDSELAKNMIQSLSRSEYGERHGVLVFDSLEPELQTVLKDPVSYEPTVPLSLPVPLDALWCLLGPVVLRYSDADYWLRRDRL